MINWEELTLNILVSVIISGTLSYFIARHFKLNVKPKIEEIYEYNRDYRIHTLSSILEFSEWNMEEIFKFLEYHDCVGESFRQLNLSDGVVEQFTERAFRLDQAYADVYKIIADSKQYVAGDELLLFLDFINESKFFAEEMRDGKYNPEYLRKRGKTAKLLVERFEKYFTEDFVQKWKNIDDSRLE